MWCIEKYEDALKQNTCIHNCIKKKKKRDTCSVLQYGPLQEKCDKYGNWTLQQDAISHKKLDKIVCFKQELRSFLPQHAFYSVVEFVILIACGVYEYVSLICIN